MQGWTAESFVGSSAAGKLSGWGQVMDSHSGIDASATFSLGGRSAGWVLFWMIDPGPTRQAEVQELTVT